MRWSAELAHEVAARAHAGTFDKAGNPYLGHPERVAEIAESLRTGPLASLGLREDHVRAVALLHDVIEDTDVTLDELAALGAPMRVLEALALLTHPDHEPYLEYVQRVARNPLARLVKLADNLDNASEERLALLPEATASRLRAKYAAARPLLESELP